MALVICSPLLSVTGSMNLLQGESLYLKRLVEPAGEVSRLGDLFHGDEGLRPALQHALPRQWIEPGTLMFLSARGVEELLLEAGFAASVVGRGVWIVPPDTIDLTDMLDQTLARLSPEATQLPLGFTLDGREFMELHDEREFFRFSTTAEGLAVLDRSSGRRLALLVPIHLNNSVDTVGDTRVKAGSTLEVLISTGGMLIKAAAIANRSGSVGERIPVTLKSTRRRVEAQIIDAGLAEVRL